MQTFADWLCYYNNLDVAPDLEALDKMRAFYTEKGIDILKDAVSLPGVSLHYLLRGTIDRGAELWTPCKEAYEMLKEAMVGGPSIVFKRFHEAGVTQIRPHRFKKSKKCRRIIGYDANALYLSTMLREMPGGKGEVKKKTGQEGLERGERQQMVRVRRSRHRDTTKAVDEVRRNAAIFLHQADS